MDTLLAGNGSILLSWVVQQLATPTANICLEAKTQITKSPYSL